MTLIKATSSRARAITKIWMWCRLSDWLSNTTTNIGPHYVQGYFCPNFQAAAKGYFNHACSLSYLSFFGFKLDPELVLFPRACGRCHPFQSIFGNVSLRDYQVVHCFVQMISFMCSLSGMCQQLKKKKLYN